MKWRCGGVGFVFVLAVLLSHTAWGELIREANTTLQLPATPAQLGYGLQQAFGRTFSGPVALATPPGETNRLFIVEKDLARILVITNVTQAVQPAPLVFLNIRSRTVVGGEQGLLGLAFHPGYASNGYFYVFYTSTSGGRSDRLSRFQVSSTNINVADTNETVLINQLDEAENHNGGDLHFGPDGYLYVSLGDEGGGGDNWANSQRITKDFFAGIIRIDVDKREGNLPPNRHAALGSTTNYFVPADNPFVGATNYNGVAIANTNLIRTEFWATGLRNPWRMSFDPLTGTLWCADVGQNLYEEVNIIVKGGNYGWNYREGAHPFSGVVPAGAQLIDPVFEYDRSLGFSVTGGRVYRGNKISQLYGAYIFGDYGSGRIWALRTNSLGRGITQQLIANSDISAFGVDPSNGDILVCDVVDGQIRRLVYSATSTGTPLPATLADTGAFSDLTNLTVNAGIVPYELNLPFWSDGAVKTRWFSVPNATNLITFNATNAWQFPTGTVFVKHFEIQTNDNPVAKRRLETRFIVRNTNGVYGVTYRWTNGVNAELVGEEGLDEPIEITESGTNRTQVWRYPSRAECLTCHNAAAGWVLGFNTAQLNRDVTHGGDSMNQIAALAKAGYFSNTPPDYHGLLALAPINDSEISQEFRVRSYLEANCAQCHRPGGLALGNFDARIHTPTDLANIINGPLLNNFGNAANRTIVPGSEGHSIMLRRMSVRGPIQMPPIATRLIDAAGVELLRNFILGESTNRQSFAQWQSAEFTEPLGADAGPNADPDLDGASNMLEWLAQTEPNLGTDAWSIEIRFPGTGVEILADNPPNRAVIVEWTDSSFAEWKPVDTFENRIVFDKNGGVKIIGDDFDGAEARYYRARIVAP